jgi:putative ABC transport system substrate-binding protein
MVNSPTTIADTYITKKLTSPKFRFVSENTIPIQTGTIKSMARPGGNVTGVGVLIQMRSAIRLMKMINPGVKRLAFASWDRVSQLNQWFEQDIREACKQEGIELAEFRRCPYAEDEYAFLARWDTPDPTVFAMEGVSAWVNKDGSDLRVDDWKKAVQGLEHLAVVTYDELPVSYGLLAGTTVVWEDIGLQLAEKALLVLNGQNPGDIPWDYPRKFNIMVNAKAAKDKGITLPQEVINAAYRVYTDYNGTFIQGTK